MKLSNSAINKYQSCPQSYRYRYIENLVSIYKSGALYFGSALDTALNVMLLHKEEPNIVEKTKLEFLKAWEVQEDQLKRPTDLKYNTNIVYAKSDFDMDLLTKADWAQLYSACKEFGLTESPIQERQEILQKKEAIGWDNLKETDKKYYNFTNWLSLKNKGLFMIEAYYKEIIPRLKRVIEVQKYISLSNGDDDELHGYVDLIAELEDGSIAVLDNKTSSIEYKKDSVKKSSQLAIYKTILNHQGYNITKAGYLVLRKGLKKNLTKLCKSCGFKAEKGATHKVCNNTIDNKRCNGEWDRSSIIEVETQIIIDDIPETFETLVIENINLINSNIKNNSFFRNLSACEGPFGLCEYYEKCHFNKETSLIKKDY